MPNDMTHIDKIQALTFAIGKKMQTELLEQMQASGLTPPQFYILKILDHYGASRATQLAEKMYVKPSAITVMTDRLIDHGLVERYHDDNDRRVVVIELTKKGKTTVEEAMAARNEHIAKYFSHLELQEREDLLRLFEKLETIICGKPEKKEKN
ncbi:MarR family transcriptional regulator [Bacillus mycoides]|jgi:DNA-binding MarR family transcriptional regulator|uniref:MarR family transcriptional regulator n=1 Tax=Bacillus thuringiensis serovar navarrensis TaxID=339658 RepID=A0A243ALN5_BACTU|nr:MULTISPECIES: MarR family transcriptional regulator [Bacillus cereus group]KXY36022.1 MarR family transcriptional regulator [Bacillus cereus]MCQ6568340.1 MarR family transcriptional regulator [Bacillus mycoides]MEC5239209.1 MarR family transcriptional regulator [Bacillus mycoides]MEC5266783.1 MarR family transcriptional regulator [Bacillus mycoides]MED1269479.1 MarR family transcriptional regulator [Bacillus mycoides]